MGSQTQNRGLKGKKAISFDVIGTLITTKEPLDLTTLKGRGAYASSLFEWLSVDEGQTRGRSAEG